MPVDVSAPSGLSKPGTWVPADLDLWQSRNRRQYAAQGGSRRHAATASNATFRETSSDLSCSPKWEREIGHAKR